MDCASGRAVGDAGNATLRSRTSLRFLVGHGSVTAVTQELSCAKAWGKHLGVRQEVEDLLAAEASHRGVAERFQGAAGLWTLIWFLAQPGWLPEQSIQGSDLRKCELLSY